MQDSYFKHSVQRHFYRRWEPEYREALKKRQIWCEGTFAAQKWGQNLTRVLRRSFKAAEDHCLLSATALNLKKDDKMLSLTHRGVFFVALTILSLLIRRFVNSPTMARSADRFGDTPTNIFAARK